MEFMEQQFTQPDNAFRAQRKVMGRRATNDLGLVIREETLYFQATYLPVQRKC
jgi:hypothetical protein